MDAISSFPKPTCIIFIPLKHCTDSPDTPKAKHTEVAIRIDIVQNFVYQLIRHGGDDIEEQPRSRIPQSDQLLVVDQNVGRFVEISDEEGQHDVDQEEAIDDIVRDVERPGRLREEAELERRHPRRVED